MKTMKRKIATFLLLAFAAAALAVFAPAKKAEAAGIDVPENLMEETVEDKENPTTVINEAASETGTKALAAGIAIGLGALGGTLAMGMAIFKSVDGIARQPEAEGKIRTTLMLGLVFIETVVIYALIVTILIVFVM